MDNRKSFVDYVNSVVNLDTLEKLTNNMDKDIEESQELMSEIKVLLGAIPSQKRLTSNGSLRHDDMLNFLELDVPKLLLPETCDSVLEIDLDDVIVTMKNYVEELKKNIPLGPKTVPASSKDTSSLDLNQYAFSLDQLGKRLANIKLNEKEEFNYRCPELEDKLTQL